MMHPRVPHSKSRSSLGEVRLTSSPLLHTVSSAPPSDQPSPEDDPFPRLSPAPPDPPALNTQVAHGSLGEEAAHTSTPSVAMPATSSVSPITLRPTLTPAVSSRSSNTQMPTTIGLGPASGKGASTATSPLSTPSTTFTTTATSTTSMTSPNSTTSMTSPTSPASSPPTTSRTERLDATPGEESLLEGQLRTLATPPTPESLPRQNLDAPGRPTRPSRTERPLPSPTSTEGHTPGRSDEDKGFPMTPSPHPAAAVRLTKGVRSFISPQLARIWGAGEDEDEWKKANHEPSRARANAPPWMKIRRRRRRYPGDGGDEGNGSSDGALSKSTASQTELRTKLGAQEKDVMGEAKGRRNGGEGNTAIPGKYGGPSESFPVEMSVADRYEAGREGRRTPIDFKVTKTGDFGGFSVTKTEEVDPINGFSVTRTEVDPARGRVVVTKAGEGQRSSSGGSKTTSGRQGLSRRVNPQDKLSPEAKASTSKAEEPSPRFRQRDPQPETSASKRERGKMEDKGGGNHAGGDKTPGRKENPDGKEETPDKTRVPQDDLESKLSRQVGSATVKPSTAERSRSKTQTDPKTQQKTSDSSDVTLRNSAMTPLSSTNGPLPPPTLRIHSRSSTLYPGANKTKHTQQVNAEAEEKVDVDASIFDLPVDEAGPESRLHYQREMSDRRRPSTAAPTRVFPVELLDEVEEQNSLPEEEERRREKNLPKSTTLSSVFSEELIPPLPNQWDDDWRNAGSSRSDTETERQSDIDDVPPYESGDHQPPDIQKEKQRTTKYQESSKASGGVTSDRRRAEVRPALGKADLRASSWPGPGERVEFVTVVPGGHWDVWGGPTLWDSLTPHSNNSHTNPQVYSVYWGDTGGPGSPPGWPEGVWVIRGGSLLAIMALVVTISVQVARDGPAHRAVPTAADALARAHHSQHATLATNLATSLASAHVLLIFGIQEPDMSEKRSTPNSLQ
ncbi:serine/arginine repetitive matrix protein 2-like [Penaeus indicus]|uniref:serine/arginine repetitive matrix protein 2-like n=1 Tax=Penaeus indicus TaxID=29960 RepID=UPI00300D7090